MNKGVDKGGVAAGMCDVDLVDTGRRHRDRYLVFLETPLGNDNVNLLRGIIRECFLFLWSDINKSSIRGDTLGGLSSVSASFRHRGI